MIVVVVVAIARQLSLKVFTSQIKIATNANGRSTVGQGGKFVFLYSTVGLTSVFNCSVQPEVEALGFEPWKGQ